MSHHFAHGDKARVLNCQSRLTALSLVLPIWAAMAAPPAVKPSLATGIEVPVTAEMTGAGIVSSGTVLPPYSTSDRQPHEAGAVLGQALALPDRDCRPT
jgi:hypothetical protein